jgi:cytochrome c biogenesis protein CcdA
MERFSKRILLLVLGSILSLAGKTCGQVPDVFAPENQAKAVQKQTSSLEKFSSLPNLKLVGGSGAKSVPFENRIDLAFSVSPLKVERGQIVTVTVLGKLRPGFHTYPMTKRAAGDAQTDSMLSRFVYLSIPGMQPLQPIREEPKPEFRLEEGVGTLLVYNKEFTWSQDLLVLPNSESGPRKLEIGLKMTVCDKDCVLGQPRFEKLIDVVSKPALVLDEEIQKRLAAKEPPLEIIPVPDVPEAPVTPTAPVTLMALIPLSMGYAFLMLCTPCVFPMVPITVSIFLKQSAKEHHNALLTAAVYAVTIILMLTVSVLILGGLVVWLANNVWMNLGLGVLMVYFALSLFGMYEIELPRGLARFTNANEERGGYAGIIFMALTFTITSFTCTGPFLGPLLAGAKEAQLTLVYSATFASPFFFLALFPSLSRKLPKSGGWLNAVKVVMGFVEIALALKFLANSDLAFNPGRPALFNYETVLCAYIALSLACGLYLLGIFRLPHDSPVESLSVPRMLLASIFMGFAVYIAPALWRVTPQGIIGDGLVAFLPLDTKIQSGELHWYRDYQAAWEVAVKEHKLIFIDFTGQNCVNCRYNEKKVFPLSAVQQELKQYVLVQLYTDYVPDPGFTRSQAEGSAAKNMELQLETYQDIANPFYAIIRPDKSAGPFAEAEGKRKLVGARTSWTRKGQISESGVPDFVTFLSAPLRSATVASGGNNTEPPLRVVKK